MSDRILSIPLFRGRIQAVLLAAILSLAALGVEARTLPDFVPLVEAAAPAVVNISTTQKVRSRARMLPPDLQIPGIPRELLDEWLRRFQGEDGMPEEFDSNSLGSGFIVSPDGYVITNHHVISEADEVIVRLHDRREFKAEVIGSDAKTDVALLKIDAEGLPTLKFGDSEKLKVGEWVLAIGSPFGFDYSATAGIVSAKGRSLPSETYVPFIQTDVAINPGNSGGPLFNLDGEVVGINSQIYSRTGGFMGLSFAIPVEVAMEVVEQIKTQGYVSRGWLGVLIQEVTRDLAESFGMKKPAGALIAQVFAGSPAEKAGLRVGDVIVNFGDAAVPDSGALPRIVGRTRVGEAVPVKILREGKPLTIRVKIGEMPSDEELARKAPSDETDPEVAGTAHGLTFADVPAELRRQADLAEGGALVSDVSAGPGRDAGIRSGDVLVLIAGRKVEGSGQAVEALNRLEKGRNVPVLVLRPTGPVFLALKIPD